MKPVHAHASIASATRKAKIANTPKYPAGIINLQVLGSGAKGAPSSLYVFTDQTRYLFNCGEGSQRLAHEHKMKLAKLDNIFITRKTWEMIGGLPGLVLTMEDIGVPTITLHGPPDLDKLFIATSRFVITKNLNIAAANCLDNVYFEDHVMRIDYVKLSPQTTIDKNSSGSSGSDSSLPEDDDIDYHPPLDGSKRHLEITAEEYLKKPRLEQPYSSTQSVPEDKEDCIMCYICRPKEKEGALLIDRCRELGVPAGPLLGKLKAGHNVTLPNGNVVLASDVKTPSFPGPLFLVVDCPTEDYIDPLVTNALLSKYQKQNANGNDSLTPKVIVHFTPENILLDTRYISWMESFDSITEHLLINDSCRSLGSEAVHRLQHKLNIVDDKIFPLLHSDGERTAESTTNSPSQLGDSESRIENDYEVIEQQIIPAQLQHIKVPIIMGETLLRYHIRSQYPMGFDYSAVVRLNPKEYKEGVMALENFSESYEDLQGRISHLEKTTSHDEFPNILFLGTGSCAPSKGRNVSGILLQITENTRMLLDCGEGTYCQLLRFYGPHEATKVLVEIKAIYVSHLHADHHLGLVSLLTARRAACQQLDVPFVPLVLIAPHQILYWLSLYNDTFEKIKATYKLMANAALTVNYDGPNPILNKQEIFDSLGFEKIETVLVRHCANAFGVALKHKLGWKITYSGDTMPCDSLVELGRDSDVCIHEATMEDELSEDAKSKQHSTTSEAIEIGEKMKAKFTLLTHFSQRYAKVPKIDSGLAPNVGIAFDNMLVRLSDLPKLPSMYPIFQCMFAEDYEEMKANTLKRQCRELK